MARYLTQPWRRILPYQNPSRWWHEQSLKHSPFLLKSLSDVRSPSISCVRFINAQASPAAQTGKAPAIKLSQMSPGFVYEPYSEREPISFWRRCFTRSGFTRTKDEFFEEVKSAYSIVKLKQNFNYTKKKFYEETAMLYQEINFLMANGDKKTLRKFVTENMYSVLKNEIKQNETRWSRVHWEMLMPIVRMRTLRARLIQTDRDDPMKSFAQITLEFLSKQKFEAYDSNGAVVAGDKDKEVLVRDIWIFERSFLHDGSYWRLCGRIKV